MLKAPNNPIVILGMHRSGTTLLTQILSGLGVFMGENLSKHHESQYFNETNDWILQIAHGSWDYPKPLFHLLEEPGTRKKVVDGLTQKINSMKFRLSYVGLQNLSQFYGSHLPNWGWKDPRTTLTWPLWRDMFPDARFIYIARNGVDVAQSLFTRESKRLGNIQDPYYSLRCTSLNRAFEVWEEYNSFFFDSLEQNPDLSYFQFRYEDFLADPKPILSDLLGFIGLNALDTEVQNQIDSIDVKRAYSFSGNPELQGFYQEIKDRPMMRKLNYNQIES